MYYQGAMNPKQPTSHGSQGGRVNKKYVRQNVVEALKDIGSSTTQSLKKDLVQGTSKDFFRQLVGMPFESRKVKGELQPGESVSLEKAYTGEHERLIKEKRQVSHLRRLESEEKVQVEQKANTLKLQLNALQQELLKLAQSTASLTKEAQAAAMTAPVEPGVYHIMFFEKLLEFVKSFRKKINSSSLWLHATNKRAEKKNYWARYKKHKSKFLLSPDHYLTRSAG